MKSSLDRVRSTYSAGVKAEGRGKARTGRVASARGSSRRTKADEAAPVARSRGEGVREVPGTPEAEGDAASQAKLKDLQDELDRTKAELWELQKAQNDLKCQAWLQGASGKSTVLARSGKKSSNAEDPGADEGLRSKLAEKDRVISELRAQVGAFRLQRESSVKAQVDAGVSRGMKDAEARHAASLSRRVREVESKSKATVNKLAESLKSFVGGKVVECLEKSLQGCEEDLRWRLDQASERVRGLARRQEGLRTLVAERAGCVEAAAAESRAEMDELRQRNSQLAGALSRARDDASAARSQLSTKDEQLRERLTRLYESQGHSRRLEARVLEIEGQASSRASEFVEANKSLQRKLEDARVTLVEKDRVVSQLEAELRDANQSRASKAASEEEHARLVEELEEMARTSTRLEGLLRESRGENASLIDRVRTLGEDLEAEREKSRACMMEARMEIERQNEKAMEVEREVQELRLSLRRASNDSGEDCKRLSEALEASSSEIGSLKSALAEAQEASEARAREAEDCRVKLSDARKAADLLRSQADKAMKQCEDILLENRSMKEQLGSAKEQSRNKLRQMSAELQEAKGLLKVMRKERHDADARDFKSKGDLQDCKGRMRKLEGALKASNERSKRLGVDLEKLQTEHSDMESKLQSSKSEHEKGTKSSLEQVVALQSELIQTTRSVLLLKEEGEKKDERIASMAADLLGRKAEASALSREVEVLKRQKTEMRSQAALMKTKLASRNDSASPARPVGGNEGTDTSVAAVLREATNTKRDKSGKDREEFGKVLGRLKRINKKYKLKLAPVIKDAEAKLGREGSLVQLIYTTITGLDRAEVPLDYQITLSTGFESHGAAPVTPELGEQPAKLFLLK